MRNVILLADSNRVLTNARLVRGVIGSGIFPSVVFCAEVVLTSDGHWLRLIFIGISTFICMALLCVVITSVAGLPLIVFLRKYHSISWLSICTVSTIIGFILASILIQWLDPSPDIIVLIGFQIIGVKFGLISGIGFCIGAKFYSRSTLIISEVYAAQASVAGAKDA